VTRPLTTAELAAAEALGYVPDALAPWALWCRDTANANRRVSPDEVRAAIARHETKRPGGAPTPRATTTEREVRP
jgi:hypothetical protein